MGIGLDDRRIAGVFRGAVLKNFSFLKETDNIVDLFARCLPMAKAEGVLMPVCRLHLEDHGVISKLAEWREKTSYAFPTRFPVTFEGTAKWLRTLIEDSPGRILFLILDGFGNRVGHAGFANCLSEDLSIEADNIVRGEELIAPGIMGSAMKCLMSWAHHVLGPKKIRLRVMEENKKAISFYAKMGFREYLRIPLRRVSNTDREEFLPLAGHDQGTPDSAFIAMEYCEPILRTPQQTILTAGPSISSRECSYVTDAVRNGWNAQWSGYLTKFEQSVADYLSSGPALATSSCTGAMHIALLALGIGPGDEVIVPDITWVATANVVTYVGAIPVFADVQEDTWCLDPISFEQKLTPRTKAVIPVHLYGHPAPMEEILGIAKRYGLYVIEDAAPSLGAEYEGTRTGTFGDFAAFSFQGAKLAVTGEGGILVVNNTNFLDKVRKIWDQGRVSGTFWIDSVGYKYKMSNLQAAMGLAQLERIEELVEAKRRIFSWYESNLRDCDAVSIQREADWARSIYWMSNVTVHETAGVSRDELIRLLAGKGIQSRPVFPAISQYPIWISQQGPNPTAKGVAHTGLNLPSGVCLRKSQIDFICECLRDAFIS